MYIFNFKIGLSAKAYAKFKISITRHQVGSESRKYYHSTQNQKLHQTVLTDFFRKITPKSYFFTNAYNKDQFSFCLKDKSPAEIIYDSKIFFVSDSVKILSDSEALEDIRW